MDISNPRRILAIGAPNAGVLQLLKDLTGDAPSPIDNSTAGLSHTLTLKTSYYAAEIPIWIDEISSLTTWKSEFLKPEATEVVSALGAWIFCFKRPLPDAPDGHAENLQTIQDTMKAVQDIIEKATDGLWDGVCLAVAMPQSTVPWLEKDTEEWEDLCRACGFEYVDAEKKGKNEFGERLGVERVREALEANDWEGDGDRPEFGDEDGFEASFDAEEAEMGIELFGMKGALSGTQEGEEQKDEEALQVEELERMMLRMQAVRDMSAGMPEEQRKQFATKAVNDFMKSF